MAARTVPACCDVHYAQFRGRGRKAYKTLRFVVEGGGSLTQGIEMARPVNPNAVKGSMNCDFGASVGGARRWIDAADHAALVPVSETRALKVASRSVQTDV